MVYAQRRYTSDDGARNDVGTIICTTNANFQYGSIDLGEREVNIVVTQNLVAKNPNLESQECVKCHECNISEIHWLLCRS